MTPAPRQENEPLPSQEEKRKRKKNWQKKPSENMTQPAEKLNGQQ